MSIVCLLSIHLDKSGSYCIVKKFIKDRIASGEVCKFNGRTFYNARSKNSSVLSQMVYRKSHRMLVRTTRGYDYKGIHNTRYAAEFLLSPRSISEMYRYMDDSITRAWIRFLFGRLLCQFFFAASSKRVSNLHQRTGNCNNCWTVVAVEPGTMRKNTGKLREQISATMDRKIVHVDAICVLSRYNIKFRVDILTKYSR